MAGSGTLEAWMTWAFSPTISAILVTLLISLISPVLLHHFYFRKADSKELPTFLLLGPSGSGKTSLLTLVCTAGQGESKRPQTDKCSSQTAPCLQRTPAKRHRQPCASSLLQRDHLQTDTGLRTIHQNARNPNSFSSILRATANCAIMPSLPSPSRPRFEG